MDYAPTPSTRVRRRPQRASYDSTLIHGILDEALIGSLAVIIDGASKSFQFSALLRFVGAVIAALCL